MKSNNIAIILARGNSKRLPRKNILNFHGKPLIYWTIQASINSNIFDRVLVSTDDEEIANISISYGAEVPFLRKYGADDFTSSSEATLIALSQAEEFWGKEFRYVSQLMANCPLRDANDIKNSFHTFIKSKSNSQISCFKYGWINPWWALKLDNHFRGEKIFADYMNKRSQDLPDLYCPTGAVWFADRDKFVENKNFYMEDTRYQPLEWTSAVDIDEESDLLMADIVFKMKNTSTNNSRYN